MVKPSIPPAEHVLGDLRHRRVDPGEGPLAAATELLQLGLDARLHQRVVAQIQLGEIG